MSRIYEDKATIDTEAVKSFFASRRKEGEFGPNLQQDHGLAARRDRNEKEMLLPTLRLGPESSVLDIGCGTGRWAAAMAEAGFYLGLDYVEDYIEDNRRRFAERTNLHFQVMSAAEPDTAALLRPNFSIVIIAGLMVYLNDDACDRLLRFVAEVSEPSCQVYIRESVSIIGTRLSLKDFYSEELGSIYNAIYRTPEEYRTLIDEHLVATGFEVRETDVLLKGDLANRDETNQQYFLCERTPID